MIKNSLPAIILFTCVFSFGFGDGDNAIHIRINQIGYLPGEYKSGIVFSHGPVRERFELIEEGSKKVVFTIKTGKISKNGWGSFAHYYELNFSHFNQIGNYYIKGAKSNTRSSVFSISGNTYENQQEKLLEWHLVRLLRSILRRSPIY